MKNLQQKLFLVLALSLCGLCGYQWYVQTLQRNAVQKLTQALYEKSVAIQDYTNSLRTMDGQIARMDARITELKTAARTNADLVVSQRREINRWQSTAESLTNQIAEFKEAAASLQGKLKEAYEGISKQNDALKELTAQRNEFVRKFNESVKDRNEVVSKYNDLVRQAETNQAPNSKP